MKTLINFINEANSLPKIGDVTKFAKLVKTAYERIDGQYSPKQIQEMLEDISYAELCDTCRFDEGDHLNEKAIAWAMFGLAVKYSCDFDELFKLESAVLFE